MRYNVRLIIIIIIYSGKLFHLSGQRPGINVHQNHPIRDISYGAICEKILYMSSYNLRCRLNSLYSRSRACRVASQRAGPVGHISYNDVNILYTLDCNIICAFDVHEVRHCGLVESARAWDGTCCEFDSCSVGYISYPMFMKPTITWVPFGVLWVHMA